MKIASFVLSLALAIPYAQLDAGTSSANGSSNANNYSQDGPKLSKTTPILMLPMNDNKLLTDEDEEILRHHLDQKMQAMGFNVKYFNDFGDDKTSQVWRNYIILTSHGLIESPQTVQVMQSLLRSFNFEGGVIVVPSVVQRITKLDGGMARWDGSEQELRTTMDLGLSMQSWNVKRPTYSLKLKVYDPDGKWVMDAYGGISFPLIVNAFKRELFKKDELFAHPKDRVVLENGLNIALQPFLSEQENK